MHIIYICYRCICQLPGPWLIPKLNCNRYICKSKQQNSMTFTKAALPKSRSVVSNRYTQTILMLMADR